MFATASGGAAIAASILGQASLAKAMAVIACRFMDPCNQDDHVVGAVQNGLQDCLMRSRCDGTCANNTEIRHLELFQMLRDTATERG